jgi:membrane-bound lytic murein transglycosylase B
MRRAVALSFRLASARFVAQATPRTESAWRRPKARAFRLLQFILAILWLALPQFVLARGAAANDAQSFQAFIESLWPDAQAHGVSRRTFHLAFKGVTFDPKVVAETERQPEFVRPIWEYLASAVSPSRIERAKSIAETHRRWFDKAHEAYGVDPGAVIGIWGLETDFGAYRGSNDVVRSLASLAYKRYRGDMFRDELIAALQILEEGDVERVALKGSWAGATGQTQLLPTNFLQYAVDFEDHGKRDIWTSAPDSIGSIANYLGKHGWSADEPWGFEVVLPKGFVLAEADFSQYASFDSFAERGVKRADGRPMPRSGKAQFLMPAGLKGPTFLATPNFKVIKSYNDSTAYALAVALLGDRATGAAGLVAAWPTRERSLSAAQIRDVQTRLHKLGYEVGEIDGKFGDIGQAALRGYQQRNGLVPDGYPTPAILARLRKSS